jgi:8-oxo-dGTP pyrophosphatase MutT (NUDIX family)
MVAEHDGRVVLVHNSWRQEWELPVGEIPSDETARETAVRRFVEETGTAARDVEFVGVGTVQLGHERSIQYVAVFRTRLGELAQFEASDEVDKLAWWDTVRDFEGLSPIDEHLARLAIDARS